MSPLKKGLGSKGLGIEALINNQMNDFSANSEKKNGVMEVDINKIEPNRLQPRKQFQEEALEELAQSLKEYGIIQPLIVKKESDYYEIIAGERRWRAAKIAGLETVPVIVKDYTDSAAFEIALIENIQRENLNPIEEAEGFRRLMEDYHLSQENIAEKVGKNRSTITNSLRLLNLDKRVKNFVIENKISVGHAKVLLSLSDKDQQFELAERIIEEGFSVRATEALIKQEFEKKTESLPKEEKKKAFQTERYSVIESNLRDIFGTQVKLNIKKNKGKIEIEYYSDEDLDRLLGLIKNIEN